MLRARLTETLKTAMKARDARRLSAVRMILAKLKERDVEARGKGNMNGIGDDEILAMMQGMIRQRRESIEIYEKGKRPDLAQIEQDEIRVIESFLPRPLSDDEMAAAIQAAIAEVGASGMKDMGRVMAKLKERHAGTLDFARASQLVKARLG